MAKYERTFKGDFDDFLDRLHKDITRGSLTASYEGGSNYKDSNVRLAVRVYERYSMMGKNRVSLSVTLLGNGNNLFLTGIAAGGSQAMFFKINTMGERAFLEQCARSVENYIRSSP